jgi:hypothetical protein
MKILKTVSNNPINLLISYVISILVATVLFSYYEATTLFDSFYWASITSLTIGYGDISPVTVEGKLISIVFGMFWIFFVIPSIVSQILSRIITDENEFTHHEQEELKKILLDISNKQDLKNA